HNAFVMLMPTQSGSYPMKVWVYCYSGCSNVGSLSVAHTPGPGSLNKTVPTASTQSWAFDSAVAVNGPSTYVGWVETGATLDRGPCQNHETYVYSFTAGVKTGPLGGSDCTAMDGEFSGNSDSGYMALAVVNGTLWAAWEKGNNAGNVSAVYAKSLNG